MITLNLKSEQYNSLMMILEFTKGDNENFPFINRACQEIINEISLESDRSKEKIEEKGKL